MYLIFLHFRIPLLHFTSLITFQPPFLQILDFLLNSNSRHFTSVHLSHFSPLSCKYSISSSIRIPVTSLHFTYHISASFLQILDFLLNSNSRHFTSLITFQPPFLQILDFLLHSNSRHFTSLHFTYHSPDPLPNEARFGEEFSVCPYLCCTGRPWTRDL